MKTLFGFRFVTQKMPDPALGAWITSAILKESYAGLFIRSRAIVLTVQVWRLLFNVTSPGRVLD